MLDVELRLSRGIFSIGGAAALEVGSSNSREGTDSGQKDREISELMETVILELHRPVF